MVPNIWIFEYPCYTLVEAEITGCTESCNKWKQLTINNINIPNIVHYIQCLSLLAVHLQEWKCFKTQGTSSYWMNVILSSPPWIIIRWAHLSVLETGTQGHHTIGYKGNLRASGAPKISLAQIANLMESWRPENLHKAFWRL